LATEPFRPGITLPRPWCRLSRRPSVRPCLQVGCPGGWELPAPAGVPSPGQDIGLAGQPW